MKYYIGIDGGGSKTKFALADEKLEVLNSYIGEPTALSVVDVTDVAEILVAGINYCLNNHLAALNEVELISIALSGAGREKIKGKLTSLLEGKLPGNININIINDAEAALEGAFAGKSGAILISGTGSILYYKDEKNNLKRIGGCGRLIGDEGSGYSIGRKGLLVAAKSFDGRICETILTDILADKFEIETQEDLINKVYHYNFAVQQFAESVIQAAGSGDNYANDILVEEAEELAAHLSGLDISTPVCLSGSLLTNDNIYKNILIDMIKAKGFNLTEPIYPPEIGAILLTKNSN